MTGSLLQVKWILMRIRGPAQELRNVTGVTENGNAPKIGREKETRVVTATGEKIVKETATATASVIVIATSRPGVTELTAAAVVVVVVVEGLDEGPTLRMLVVIGH